MSKDFRIAVIQAGWVLVGDYSVTGDLITLENSAVISRWGTTKGLGELVFNGPTAETLLMPCGVAEFPRASLLFTLKMSEAQRKQWPPL